MEHLRPKPNCHLSGDQGDVKYNGLSPSPLWDKTAGFSSHQRKYVDVDIQPSMSGKTTYHSYPINFYFDQLRVNWVTTSELGRDAFEKQRGADGILINSPIRFSSRWLFSST